MTRTSRIALALACAGASALSQAATVTTQYSPLAGSAWQVDFTLANDAAGLVLPGLSIYFDAATFADLAAAQAPTGWDPLVLQPDAGLGADGLFDVLAAAGSELQPGQTLAGFSVQFNYLGTGMPGSLRYEVYELDANGSPVVLSRGETVAAVAAVPEPATLWLGSLALGALALVRRRTGVKA